jgi:type IV pilus assembly protein PilM
MGFLQPFRNAMGIDISDQVLRMVQLTPFRKEYRVRSVSARPVPEGYIVEGEIRNPKAIRDLLRDLIRRSALKHPNTRAAIICLPERKTFTKIIELPAGDPNTFSQSLRSTLAEHIPLNLDEAYIDWQIVTPKKEKSQRLRVIVSVAPQLLVESYLEVLREAGIIPVVLEPESAALSRVAVMDSTLKGSHLIVDLGATRTGITITEGDFVAYSSTLPLSGSGLTSILKTKLGLSQKEAEQAKRICGLDPRKGKGVVKETLEPELKPLLQRTMEIIGYYEEHATKENHVSDITLVGGGASFIGLPDFISSTLNLPVRIGNWPSIIKVPPDKLRDVGASYLTAAGLALRGAQNLPWFPNHNIV